MNGNSSAHQHKPITGTQISSCLRKNLRNGTRRLSWYCSTRISTQLWWLLVTKYECCLSKPLSPATSQCVRPTRFIQNLLMEIQASALACIIKRRMRCTSGMGTSSFTSARINSGQHQNRVLSANIRPASRPRSGAGRKCSIGAGASRKWGQAGCGPLLWRSSGLIPDTYLRLRFCTADQSAHRLTSVHRTATPRNMGYRSDSRMFSTFAWPGPPLSSPGCASLRQVGSLNRGQGDGEDDIVDQCAA